jgi:hypothetical protein
LAWPHIVAHSAAARNTSNRLTIGSIRIASGDRLNLFVGHHTMTKPKLKIDIPSHIKDDDDLAAWIYNNPKLFYDAMDLDVSQLDARATVHKVTITNLEIDEHSIFIDYEYAYSAYYGCRDKNYAGTSEENIIVGARKENTLEFEKFTPSEKRSTYDEL